MNNSEGIENYDPNEVGLRNGRFMGLPFDGDQASVSLLPIPWDVTVSYGAGTASGPENILNVSPQLDLYDPFLPEAWKAGIFMHEVSAHWKEVGTDLRGKAQRYIDWLESGQSQAARKEMLAIREEVNSTSHDLMIWVREQSEILLDQGKWVGIVGGEHSVPLGFISALGERYPTMGILQIDAHMDMRESYEGFRYSHASIFHHVLGLTSVSKVVQVGIRDYCAAEMERARAERGRVHVYTHAEVAERRFRGQGWAKIAEEIIHHLPTNVYISFDIDGLDPSLCPGTGTPVPGGLAYEEAIYLIRTLVRSGRNIIGFDLCETAGTQHPWDGNVAARILYQLSIWMIQARSF